MRRAGWVVGILTTFTMLVGCAAGDPVRGATAPSAAPGVPALRVEVVSAGLEHPWDIGVMPDGSALVSERAGRFTLLPDLRPGTEARPVRADLGDVYATGEGGLMGLVVHPDFATNRHFITCQTHQRDGAPVDVRLITWRLSEDGGSAHRVGDPLVTGAPLNPSGRHSGCRPTIGPGGELLVTTGDSARPRVAQDRGSLGGKTLRTDVDTGLPAPGNPFLSDPDPRTRLIYTFGHRNAQGITVRSDGAVLIAEHGPDVDDEINRLRAGGNYGWDPSLGGTSDSYDESAPMTDLGRFPDAVPALWSSGASTEAVCGAAMVTGPQWGALDGSMAVTALKGSKLMLFRFDGNGGVRDVIVAPELDGTHGRLRGVRSGPDGALYVTTSNGSDDRVLRITPAG